MKIIITIILVYIAATLFSSSLLRYIFSAYKGTEFEETWKKSLTTFSVVYFIIGIILLIGFLIFRFLV
jgi:hypothetical protein